MSRRSEEDGDRLLAALDDDDHALLRQLRTLPDGDEPAWDRLEQDIGRAVDAEAERARRGVRGWLRRWWMPALGLGLATAAAAIVLLARPAHRDAPAIADRPAPDATPDAAVDELAVAPPLPGLDDLDDEPLVLGELGLLEAELDDEMVDDVLAALIEDDADDAGHDSGDVAEWSEWSTTSTTPSAPEDGLVPDLDLDWVDTLDDDELDAVALWIDDEAS